MIRLLDVNVLIALTWPNHVHHDVARSWFTEVRTDGWATCPLTEAGFVRISCNPSAVKQSITATDAIALLAKLRQLESHSFWAMDLSIVDLPPGILRRIQGYRQITDAVLLALAIQFGGQLATFDSGFTDLLAREELQSVRMIPI
jgi:toxin-antitoxin system PIN domain toxin